MSVDGILQEKEHPLIGIIGAAVPLPRYDQSEAIQLGYLLRGLVEEQGTLFTGGVPGVGLDVYRGIVQYCGEHEKEDRFFVLLPEGMPPPPAYTILAKSAHQALSVCYAGRNMEERRTGVAMIADALVVVNGGEGTLDEGLKAAYSGVPLVVLEPSGGAAEVFARLKRKEITLPDLPLDLDLITVAKSPDDIINYLSKNAFPEGS